MAIKAGNVIHVGNDTFLIDRIQTGGPGAVNIRRETIRETGNYLSVGQVSDIPDLSFTIESFDVSCALEALLLDVDPTANAGTVQSYDLAASLPLNIKSAFKGGASAASPYVTVESVAIPYLVLESMAYRFGIRSNAQQTATLKGDSIFYNPGSTYCETTAGSGSAGQAVATSHAAYAVVEGGVQRRTLSVCTRNRRLNFGTDYTETYGSVTSGAAVTTVHITAAVDVSDHVRIVYASPTAESFPQTVHATVTGTTATLNSSVSAAATTMVVNGSALFVVGQVIVIDDGTGSVEIRKITTVSGSLGAQTLTVAALTNAHSSGAAVAVYVPTVKPAAIRGRDIDVYISGSKKISVQSVDLTWKVTLEPDEEFGNYHYVDQDFQTPDVTGTIQFKPRDAQEMLALMQQLSGTTDPLQSAPGTTSPPLAIAICLKNPVDGNVLKRLAVPDARFDMPGYSARVLQKLTFDAKFTSDTGALTVSNG